MQIRRDGGEENRRFSRRTPMNDGALVGNSAYGLFPPGDETVETSESLTMPQEGPEEGAKTLPEIVTPFEHISEPYPQPPPPPRPPSRPIVRRTALGAGALMPWAGRLWLVMEDDGRDSGGAGLYEIDANLTPLRRPESVEGSYANRMIHKPSRQLVIGPYFIGEDGSVRTAEALTGHRLASTVEHLEDPAGKVYVLTVDGLLLETDIVSLNTRKLFDLNQELRLPDGVHSLYRAACTAGGRVVVAAQTLDEAEAATSETAGCLAEWDGQRWSEIERSPFHEVFACGGAGDGVIAVGGDNASAILMAFSGSHWLTFRVPHGALSASRALRRDWPRIRELDSERLLLDCGRTFYELDSRVQGRTALGMRPISSHLRAVPDFCAFRGRLILGGKPGERSHRNAPHEGSPQGGLWMGKPDDLRDFGKPAGWGGPWVGTPVRHGEPSVPYLMTGFDKKVVHLSHDADADLDFTIEVDFLGNSSWNTYAVIRVPAHGYRHHEFPDGFSAHWVRLTVSASCNATGHFIYS